VDGDERAGDDKQTDDSSADRWDQLHTDLEPSEDWVRTFGASVSEGQDTRILYSKWLDKQDEGLIARANEMAEWYGSVVKGPRMLLTSKEPGTLSQTPTEVYQRIMKDSHQRLYALRTKGGFAWFGPDDHVMLSDAPPDALDISKGIRLSQGDQILSWKIDPHRTFFADLHGNEQSVVIDGVYYSACEFANALRSNHRDSLRASDQVLLISCSTALGESPFAQELAQELSICVIAADERAWIRSGHPHTTGKWHKFRAK
jgi:hypothetical protein